MLESEIPEEISEDVRQAYSADVVNEVADEKGVATADLWAALETVAESWESHMVADQIAQCEPEYGSSCVLTECNSSRTVINSDFTAVEPAPSDLQEPTRTVNNWSADHAGPLYPVIIPGDYRKEVLDAVVNMENGPSEDVVEVLERLAGEGYVKTDDGESPVVDEIRLTPPDRGVRKALRIEHRESGAESSTTYHYGQYKLVFANSSGHPVNESSVKVLEVE